VATALVAARIFIFETAARLGFGGWCGYRLRLASIACRTDRMCRMPETVCRGFTSECKFYFLDAPCFEHYKGLS
jgi:hypothetical protein